MTEGQQTTISPEQQAKNDEILNEMGRRLQAEKDAAKHTEMLESLKKEEAFKNVYEKYGNEVFALNPTLKTTLDPKAFKDIFVTAATVLLERDKKIQAAPAQQPPANPNLIPANPELDKPVLQGNGIYKNGKGEVTDANGVRLVSDTVQIPDLRDAEMEANATPVEKARLETKREAQKAVRKFEYATW